MTSESSVDLREVIFINKLSKNDYDDLPDDVRESADEALTSLQNGDNVSPKMLVPMSGKLAGSEEIKIPYDTDTYRIYVYSKSKWCVIVLDAGKKKSHKGSGIPKEQRERLEDRLERAKKYCKDNEALLKNRYNDRLKLRHEQMSEASGQN